MPLPRVHLFPGSAWEHSTWEAPPPDHELLVPYYASAPPDRDTTPTEGLPTLKETFGQCNGTVGRPCHNETVP